METQAVAEQVAADLEQLKPNVVLETIEGWLPELLAFGYRLLIAVVILIIGNRIAKLTRKLLRRSFERLEMDVSVSRFLTNVAEAAVYAIAIFIAADKIGIPSASIIALLGSAGLAVGLSLQGSLSNVAGGILIMTMRPFRVNDYIMYDGIEGTVQNIGLIYTTLTTADNQRITVPNGSISNATVTTVTAQEKRRVDIQVGIGYTSDMKKAKAILYHLYESNPLVLTEEGITVYVGELGDSAVTIGGRGWTKTADYWTVKWAITEQVKEEYDRAGIEIPFQQLDVHVTQS
ncbi:MAG: mechanosensitive ion channel [Clostridiales bacterium]|nr:mechanosensitive ion channel [Clostridiales bacterium]MCD8370800.1 mechanosensitive ion channel [Clostridiales bacterium]